MTVKEKTLQKIADWSKLIGISILTITIILAFTDLQVGILDSSIGGITIGALLAFIVPFWISKISKNKKFRTFI